jgi:hypothetical protein
MADDKELEFASAEDLAVIKGDPRLSKYYNAVVAGVNKKFQSWSEEKKQLESQVEILTNQVGELDGGLLEWENWFTKNKPTLEKALTPDSNQDENREGKRGKKEVNNRDSEDDPRYNEMREYVHRIATEAEKRLSHMSKMLNYSIQVNDLLRKNPQMDLDKVLDVAKKKGYQDLSKAYEDEDAYGKELMDKRVEERLKPRLEEELTKRMTNVESGSGSMPVNFELPKELPKSFQDAGKQFLEERAKDSAKLEG